VACSSDGQSFPHLIEALDGVLRRLGGTARSWRTDRMATVVYPGTDRLRPEAAAAAKHHGVTIAVCPANRPQRKGVVGKGVQYVTGSWWRSAPVSTPAQAQADLDRWSVAVSDRRRRGRSTVGELAAAEPPLALPELPFAAEHRQQRVASREALVSFEGNQYSVAPGHAGHAVEVRARLGELHLEIYTPAGRRIARHRRALAGAGQTIRTEEHATALERAVLDAFTTTNARRRKPNRPPGERAQAEAARLRAEQSNEVVVDLEQWARAASVAAR
jgi:Mu transposase-like protein